MSHNAKFMAERLETIVGSIIESVIDPDTSGDVGFIIRTKDNKRLVVWVLSDAEGNNSGWLEIQGIV